MPARNSSTGFHAGRRLAVSAVIGAALVLPLVAMEWWAGGGFPGGAPVALFATLWLLIVASCFVVWPAVRRFGPSTSERPPRFRSWAAVTAALLLGWVWISIVRDQWPCFRGLPNCD